MDPENTNPNPPNPAEGAGQIPSGGQGSTQSPSDKGGDDRVVSMTQKELGRKLSEARRMARERAIEDLLEQGRVDLEKFQEQNTRYQQLANERGERIKELETIQAERDRLVDLMTKQVEARTANFPDEVKKLMPKNVPLEELLAWVEEAQALVTRLTGQPQRGNGTGPNPLGSGESDNAQKLEEMRAKARQSGVYSPF